MNSYNNMDEENAAQGIDHSPDSEQAAQAMPEEAKAPVAEPQPEQESSPIHYNDSARTTPGGYGQGWQQPASQQQPPYQQPSGYAPYYTNQGYGNYPAQQQPNQYQYNPSRGWQQPQQARPQDSYQWNFHDYDKAAAPREKKKRNRGLVVFVVALVCVLAVGLVGASVWGVYTYYNGKPIVPDGLSGPLAGDEDTAPSQSAQIEIASRPAGDVVAPAGGAMTTQQIAKAVTPSVVGVIQYQMDVTLGETGMGSGIVMTEDGYIITNAHVVAEGSAFKVILADGTPKDAELIGSDRQTDLAVLKVIDPGELIPATFGDSNALEVGEPVVAIGNPGGDILAGSLTKGVISAINREIPNVNTPLIQTDAAINPGNSGGALVNEYGQVIGINSSKIVATGFEGIGFAIPIAEAKPIIDDIITNGRVTGRVRLGIQGREIDEIDARNYNLKEGIRVESIEPGSDLENKGVQRFDIITHVDGERIYNMQDLQKILEQHKVGDQVTLTMFRSIGMTRSDSYEVAIVLIEG